MTTALAFKPRRLYSVPGAFRERRAKDHVYVHVCTFNIYKRGWVVVMNTHNKY